MKDIIQTFKSHFKPLKLENVKESKLDLTPIKVPYLGKCS